MGTGSHKLELLRCRRHWSHGSHPLVGGQTVTRAGGTLSLMQACQEGDCSPSRLMRKVPWLSRASGGRSTGSSLVRFTLATIISSASWEDVEVASPCRHWEANRAVGVTVFNPARCTFGSRHLFYSCTLTSLEDSLHSRAFLVS